MKNKITLVISGFPGIGKTTLSSKYENVLDLESSKYKWLDYTGENVENYKGTYKNKNKEFPSNYINAVIANIGKYDIILVSQSEDVRECLTNNNIEFKVAFPSLDCKEEYINRIKNRQNSSKFIEDQRTYFNERIEKLLSLNIGKIILNPGEYLEDKIYERGIK